MVMERQRLSKFALIMLCAWEPVLKILLRYSFVLTVLRKSGENTILLSSLIYLCQWPKYLPLVKIRYSSYIPFCTEYGVLCQN